MKLTYIILITVLITSFALTFFLYTQYPQTQNMIGFLFPDIYESDLTPGHFGGIGSLQVFQGEEKWQLTHSADNEANFILWTTNTSKKTDIGFILAPGVNPANVNLSDKFLRYLNGSIIQDDKDKDIVLKYETSKCDSQDCFFISLSSAKAENINESIKLGEFSIVTEYQSENKLEYTLDWANTNITLFKNISGTWNNTVNDIFVTTNNRTYKFGANDSTNNATERYLYQVQSTRLIVQNQWYPYIYRDIVVGGSRTQERHHFDFFDICSKGFENGTISSACTFDYYTEQINSSGNLSTHYFLDVEFTSDHDIDPTISVTEFKTSESIDVNVTQQNNFTHLTISDIVPFDELVAYWTFDVNHTLKGNITYDYTDNGNDGTVNGEPFSTIGLYGSAAGFDGINDNLDLGSDSTLRPLDNFTWSLWVNRLGNGTESGNPHVVRFGISGEPFMIERDADAFMFTRIKTSSASVDMIDVIAIPTDEWTHYALNYNGTDGILYRNGLEIVFTSVTGTLVYDTNTLLIGGDNSNEFFNGSIDDFMVFNTSLTPTQIFDIYQNQSTRFKSQGFQTLRSFNITAGNNTVNVTTDNFQTTLGSTLDLRLGEWDVSLGYNDTYNGTDYTLDDDLVLYYHFDNQSGMGENDTLAIDWSGRGNNGTAIGGLLANSSGYYDGAFDFDGSNDRVNLSGKYFPSDNDTTPYTISIWVKTTDTSGIVIGQYNVSDGLRSIPIFLTGGTFCYWASGICKSQATTNIDDNEWHHLAVVRNNSNNISVFVDGVVEGIGINTNPDGNSETILGSGMAASIPYDGLLDELMIWNRTLSGAEVTELYIQGRNNWNQLPYQTVATPPNTNNYGISQSTTNILPDYRFTANGNESNLFYSPLLEAGMHFGYDLNLFFCDTGDLVTTCFLNHSYYPFQDEVISANNLVFQDRGSIVTTDVLDGIDFTFNLTGNFTMLAGGNISGYGINDTTTPGNASNIFITAEDLNITSSAFIRVDGGKLTTTSQDRAGTGGDINISVTNFYFDGTLNLDGGFGVHSGSFVSGADAGTLILEVDSNTVLGGDIFLIGGSGYQGSCSVSTGHRGNGGRILFNEPTYNLTINGTIDLNPGVQGLCRDGNWSVTNFNTSYLFVDTEGDVRMNGKINATNVLVKGTLGGKGRNQTNADLAPPGGNLTINAVTLNVTSSGKLDVGGSSATTSIQLIGGNGGILNISVTNFYFDGNISFPGGGAPSTGFSGAGGDGGILIIDVDSNTILNGNISSTGGWGINTCSATQGRRGNGGRILFNEPTYNLTINGAINLNPGHVGACEVGNWTYSSINASYVVTGISSDIRINGKINATEVLVNGVLGGKAPNITIAQNATVGGNLTINAVTLNLTSSGILNVEGGGVTGTIQAIAGNTGVLNISVTNFYMDGNITIVGGTAVGTGFFGAGAHAGTLIIDSGSNLVFNGNIFGHGGSGYNVACGNANGRRGDGGTLSINEPDFNLTFLNPINFDRGSIGACNNGTGGSITLTAQTLNISNDLTVLGNTSGNVTITSTILLFSSRINVTTQTLGGNNGTIFLNYTDCTNSLTNGVFEPLSSLVNNTVCAGGDNPPVSILSRPPDNFNSTNSSIVTFEVNATDDSQLVNVTLHVWNPDTTLNHTNFTSWNGTSNSTLFTYNFTIGGLYIWNALVTDNASQRDWGTNRTLNISSPSAPIDFNPNVTINQPQNITYTTTIIDFNVTAVDDDDMSDVYYTLNGGLDNVSMNNLSTSPTQWTAQNISVQQGTTTVFFYANDTSNNLNHTENITFFIDSILPAIIISHPANNTNFSNGLVDINFTATDTNLQTCSWDNDTFTDRTITACSGLLANITNITWSEGIHNVTLFANDTLGNENSTTISFRIDTIAPAIQFTNQTILDNESLSHDINATDGGVGVSSFYINNTANFSIGIINGTLINISFLQIGNYSIQLSVNDSLNNTNVTHINIEVQDSTLGVDFNPNVTINQPQNITYTTTIIDFNVTAVDDGDMSDVYYTLNGGLDNVSMNNLSTSPTQWTAQNISVQQGTTTVFFYANDTVNNLNHTENITFFIDSILPAIIISHPANNTNFSNGLVSINFTATDTNLQTCSWDNDTFGDRTITACSGLLANITNITWSEGIHNVTLFANDTLGNENSTTVSFRIDTLPPSIQFTNQTLLDSESLNHDINGTDLGVGVQSFRVNGTQLFNITISGGFLRNSTTLTIGNYSVNVTVNDSLGNINSTIIGIEVQDSATPVDFNPNVTINNPLNTTLNDNNITFNVTAVDDDDMSDVYYTLDGGLTNLSMNNRSTSPTQWTNENTTLPDGSHQVIFYANDTSNNLNHTENVTFLIDTHNPNITFNAETPGNATNLSFNSIYMNVTVDEPNEDTIIFNLYHTNDSLVNRSIFTDGTRLVNFTSLADGNYFINVSINDSSNQLNRTETRVITIDTTLPVVTITTPNNNTNFTNGLVDVNFTVSDTNLDTCSWDNDTFTDRTIIACAGVLANITNITWSEGIHNVTVFANDTAGNEGNASISFRIDTLPPSIQFANQTLFDNESLNHNINGTDLGVGVESFIVNGTQLFNITISGGFLRNSTTLTIGNYSVNVTVNDSLGNINSTLIGIEVQDSDIVDITAPTFDNLQNHTSTANTSFFYDLNATDSGGIDTFRLNQTTLFNITMDGRIRNLSTLDLVATYWLIVFVNDTSNNTAQGEFFIDIVGGFQVTGLSPLDMTLGYDADLVKFEDTGLRFGFRR